MPGIGYRTIKTAVGAGLAMSLASLLDWQFATFAAIIVIMCIETTKKRTILTIKDKFFASLLSLILGMIIFELLGYHPVVISIFIFLFMPILMKFRIQNGFVTSMVVFMHIYSLREASLEIFIYEVIIILIGIGIALLVNSIMPSRKKDVDKYKYQLEEIYGKILYEFHAHLINPDREWDGIELKKAEDIINKGKSIALLDIENKLMREEDQNYHYFKMREDQLIILRRMLRTMGIISSSSLNIQQHQMLSDLLLNISENVHLRNLDDAIEKLTAYETSIKKTELPKSREEFEVRASLFQLGIEIKRYLSIKRKITRSRIVK